MSQLQCCCQSHVRGGHVLWGCHIGLAGRNPSSVLTTWILTAFLKGCQHIYLQCRLTHNDGFQLCRWQVLNVQDCCNITQSFHSLRSRISCSYTLRSPLVCKHLWKVLSAKLVYVVGLQGRNAVKQLSWTAFLNRVFNMPGPSKFP
jgi:hypothetical protein